MYLLKVSFVLFLSHVLNTESCTTVSFKNIDAWVDYTNTKERFIRVQDCLSPLFTIIENGHTGTVAGISISNQNVKTLKHEAVANFSELLHTTVQYNGIHLIEGYAFSNLPSLKSIDLSHNKIRFLEDNAFYNVPVLTSLDISHNQLQHFEQNCLSNSGTILYYLYLSFNQIESIHKKSFTNLPRLHTVNVSHNSIQNVHHMAFDSLTNLTSVDLSYNRINYLPDDVFVPTPNIVILNLFSNNLTFLSEDVFRSISHVPELTILFNPFTCKCFDRIATWAETIGKDLQNQSYMECKGTTDFRNIPMCITTDERECTISPQEDLYNILHSAQPDYECFALNWFTYRIRNYFPNVSVYFDI